MFIKKPILCILAVLFVVVMIVELFVVAQVKEAFVVHEYHGLLNGKVGQPYQELIQELFARYEAGDMDALGRALKAAEDQKYEMNHVWLNDNTPEAYRESVTRILK
jgi:hypothetical protein